MTGAREAFGAALVLDMRTPLARAELAASRLLREAATPAARELAAGIGEAVAELDDLIGRALAVLLVRGAPAGSADLAGVLAELRQRLGPVLAARGVTWAGAPLESAPVAGPPARVRACCVALLRAAAALAGPGGAFELEPLREAGRPGLRLRDAGPAQADGALRARQLRGLRGQVLAQGGGVELRDGEGGPELWFGAAEEPCNAS